MRTLRSFHRFTAAALLVSGLIAAPQDAKLSIPSETYKLRNGLRVILSRDPAVPVVTVYMLYNVGSRNEQKGHTGFAHLFEHMMFEGSKNAPKGTFDQVVEGNGGVNNGSTHPDFTDYFEVLPANKLASALWLESDRMRALLITPENLTNQKEAVKQERRLGTDNQPYAKAIVDEWPTLMYKNFQSAHSVIGSFEDLNASSIDDVSQFFKTHYAPNNCVMALVGDIDIPAAKKLVEEYFGDIPAQPQPPHPDLTEPTVDPKTLVYHDKLAQVPAVVMGYMGPKRGTPDFYALLMVDILLSGGDSSMFRQDLVHGKESIVQFESDLGWPFAGSLDYRDPEDYAIFALYKPNHQADEIVKQIQDEIAVLADHPVDQKTLERAKTFLEAERIRELQSTLARARQLAQYAVVDGDPSRINSELDRIMAVTPEQIQAAAQKYLSPGHRVVLSIVPGEATPESRKRKVNE